MASIPPVSRLTYKSPLPWGASTDAQCSTISRQGCILRDLHARRLVDEITWLTLITLVVGVIAAAKRRTISSGS